MASLSLNVHTSILGSTSSGKTHLARQLFKESRRKCVFVNLQAEAIPGRETREPPPLKELWRRGKVVWTPPDAMRVAEPLEELVQRLFKLGEGIAEPQVNRGSPWCNLFVDEAHLVAPNNGPPGPLERVATQGLRYGVVLVTISQRPQQLSKTVLSQSPQTVLFRVTQVERQYLEEKLAPISEEHWAWLQQRYHWLLLDPAAAVTWQQREPI